MEEVRKRGSPRRQVVVVKLDDETQAFIERLVGTSKTINKKLDKILTEIKEIKSMNAETTRLLGELDAASTELANDIQALIDRAESAGSLTAEEINAALAPKVAFLTQLGADTNNPLPDVPPATPTE